MRQIFKCFDINERHSISKHLYYFKGFVDALFVIKTTLDGKWILIFTNIVSHFLWVSYGVIYLFRICDKEASEIESYLKSKCSRMRKIGKQYCYNICLIRIFKFFDSMNGSAISFPFIGFSLYENLRQLDIDCIKELLPFKAC